MSQRIGAMRSCERSPCLATRVRWWTRFLLTTGLLVLLALHSEPVEAQRERPNFQVYRWRGKAAFEVSNDFDARSTTDQVDVTQKEWLFREEILIGADGWIYHPAFMRFSGELGAEFNQDRQTTEPQSVDSSVDGLQLNFDLLLSILPNKPYPVTLFAGQANSQIDSPFTPRRTVNTLRYGGEVNLRNLAIAGWEVPSRLLYRHTATDTNGTFGNDTIRDEFDFFLTNETDRTRNRLAYEFESRESTSGLTSQTFVRHDLRAYQDRDLDRDGLLSSQFTFTDESGTFATRSLALIENLSLHHSETLGSSYSYSLNLQDSQSSQRLTNNLSAGFSHQLYDSLFTSGSIGASYSDSDFGQILTAEASGSIGYRKKIPGGILGLRLAPSYSYEDDNVESGQFTIVGENHGVELGELILLGQDFVVLSSVVVADAETGFLFVEGVDYTLVAVGASTNLEVIPGSNLDPLVAPFTTTVAVSFDYERLPARSFTTLAWTTGFNLYLWEHFTMDVSYGTTNQTLLSGVANETTLDDTTRLFGYLDAVFEHNRTRLEYERIRASIAPRERFRATHQLSYRPTRRFSFGAGLTVSRDRLTDSGRVTNLYGANLSSTLYLPYAVLSRLSVFARQIGQEEQDTLTFGGTISLTYRLGRLQFQLQEQLSWSQTTRKTGLEQKTREIFNTIFFRVVRKF